MTQPDLPESPPEPSSSTVAPVPPQPAVPPGLMESPVTYPYGSPPGVSYPYRPAPQYGYVTRAHNVTGRRPVARPARPVELGALAGMVVLGDLALWGGTGGLGMAALFAGVPLGLGVAVKRIRTSPRLFAIGALLVAVAARCVYHTSFGVVALGVALLAAFAMGLRQRGAHAPEVGMSALSAVAVMPGRVAAMWRGGARIVKRTRLGSFSVLPIVIPIALLGAFLAVFALANPVVANGLERVWSTIARWITLPHPLRIGMWGLLAIGLTVLLRPATRRFRAQFGMAAEGEAKGVSLSIARNALGALNVLFLGFNALDVAYLWAGSPPAGINTQHYAHSGTFWLTIALSMTTATIGVLFRKELAFDPKAKVARILAAVWVGQAFILALGAFRRIAMHVTRSGLSDLRIVGIFGTTLVCVGLVLVLIKVLKLRTFSWLLRRQLDALTIALVVYAATPTHLIAGKVNVARIQSGEYRPALHMFSQSRHAESAPALIPLLTHQDARVRQGVAALLADQLDELRTERGSGGRWAQKEFSRARALSQLEGNEKAIIAALDGADREDAKGVLLRIEKGANDDWSLEQILSVPEARRESGYGTRSRGNSL